MRTADERLSTDVWVSDLRFQTLIASLHKHVLMLNAASVALLDWRGSLAQVSRGRNHNLANEVRCP